VSGFSSPAPRWSTRTPVRTPAALRKIIEDIVLTPEQGQLGILVKGELARLLAVTVPADQAEEFRERVSLVAGASNRRYLQLWSGAA
jgi:hypothetical protein